MSAGAKPTQKQFPQIGDFSIAQVECTHFNFGGQQLSLPIFPCCKKAYPCFKCHDMKELHKYEKVKERVCSKCLTLFPKDGTCPKCLNM